jgi:hypothetical protein
MLCHQKKIPQMAENTLMMLFSGTTLKRLRAWTIPIKGQSVLRLSLWVLIGVLLTAANVEYDERLRSQGDGLGKLITKAAAQLQHAAKKRPLRLAYMNDSLEKMAQATRVMASGQDGRIALDLLEASRRDYKENHFAILLQAINKSVSGNETEADQLFKEFLLNSTTFTGFEETFLKWGEFHMIRRNVHAYLRAKGVPFEGEEKNIQAHIPFEKLIGYATGSDRPDYVMNIAFITILAGGGILLVLLKMTGVDFSRPFLSSVVTLYVISWIAYGIWVTDLAFGLPFGWSRFDVVPILFIVPTVLLLLSRGITAWIESRQPVEAGYKKCSRCRAIMMDVLKECPRCRKVFN